MIVVSARGGRDVGTPGSPEISLCPEHLDIRSATHIIQDTGYAKKFTTPSKIMVILRRMLFSER